MSRPAAKNPNSSKARSQGTAGATWSRIEGGKGKGSGGSGGRRAGNSGRSRAKIEPVPRKSAPAAHSDKRGGRKGARGWERTPLSSQLSPRLRRELAALVLAAGGALLFVGLLAWAGGNNGHNGGIIGLAGKGVAQLFGLGAWLVPVALIGGAIRAATPDPRPPTPDPRPPTTRYLVFAACLVVLGVMGLLGLFSDGQRAAEAGEGGGYIGLALSTFLSDYLTRPGAGVALMSLAVLGIIMANGVVRGEGRVPNTEYQVPSTDYRVPTTEYSVVGTLWRRGIEAIRRGRQEGEGRKESRGGVLINGEEAAGVESAESGMPELDVAHEGGGPGKSEDIAGDKSPLSLAQSALEKAGPIINMPRPDQSAAGQNAKQDAQPAMERVVSPFGYVWSLPPLKLLEDVGEVKVSQGDVKAKIKVLEETLLSFNVDAAVREVNTGPAVTQFALEPGVGVRVNRITALEKDIALALAAQHIRLEAPIPGQSRVGIEVPNSKLQVVGLRSVMESEPFVGSAGRLKMALGRDTHGRPVTTDLAKLPHLLVAGATGSGKSVFLNSMVIAFLLQFTPDDLRMLMIDPKRVELTPFNGIPHLLRPVVTDVRMEKEGGVGTRGRGLEGEGRGNGDRALTAVEALKWALWEMERRYKVFSKGVRDKEGINKVFRNIESYRTFHKENPQAQMEHLPYIVFIIDELADLMLTAPEEVETSLCRLAQLARATGIHLVVATQRPSVDVVTGLIKANFPARAAFAVTSQVDSKVILDSGGAEKLLGRGDMLYTASDESKPVRIQGVFVSDAESERVINFWRKQLPNEDLRMQSAELDGGKPSPGSNSALSTPNSSFEMQIPDWLGSGDADADSEILEQAIELAKKSEFVSVSMLQRKLRIGYNRSARLVEQMEELGLIAPANPDNRGKPREVLLGAPDSRANSDES